LPELALIEGIHQVAMKWGESFSLSLFTFRSHFAAIHHHLYYVFMTGDDGWQVSEIALSGLRPTD
jgi:hypothetical protein